MSLLAELRYVAATAVNDTTYGYDKLYYYNIPTTLCSSAKKGSRVLVPFGKGNRKRIALILDVLERDGYVEKYKPIIAVIDKEPVLSDEMTELVLWIKETTLCTYFDAFRCLIPPGLSLSLAPKFRLTGKEYDGRLTDDEQQLFTNLLITKKQKDFDLLLDYSVVPEKKAVVDGLLEKGYIETYDKISRRVNDETVRMIRLTAEYASDSSGFKTTPKQKQVVAALEDNGTASVKEILYLCNVTSNVINNMEKSGIIEKYEYETIFTPDIDATSSPDDIALTECQNAAYTGIAALIEDDKPHAALLYGVTGSGKTPVFVKLIDFTLKQGRKAMLLIPEISLTPQTLKRFQSVFGNAVAVIHSSLSLSQRLNEYKRIKFGQANIVIGTRSAVFAPIDNIGLIIIDEEGEKTYKSESAPRYHARDIAKKRCVTHNATLVMASATPAVESYYYAKSGRYELFSMDERYMNIPLPKTTIVDMGNEASLGNDNLFSELLVNEINYNLEHNEQTILLLNRRGFHTYISCCDCRQPVVCPRCSIPMTYHAVNDRIICHFCGYSEQMISKCPSCGGEHLKRSGVGTQKLEDELSRYFPTARLVRMDMDTTYSKFSYDKNFKQFEAGEYDIMLGTQMIAKGLDFPNVTLVGVLSIDKALFAGDFRSYERTFSLITQVVGRSGRGGKNGRAIIQSFVPDHYVINLAADQDYKGFYEQEIAVRKQLIYPPYCDIIVISFSSLMESVAVAAGNAYLRLISDKIKNESVNMPMKVLGPVKYHHERLGGRYRYRLVIKCRNSSRFRSFISEITEAALKLKEFSNVKLTVDINGDIY